jgi:pimeloyl-ACP methyl ester carboxylesterase
MISNSISSGMKHMPDVKRCHVDGVEIQYYERGTGQTMLLVHGWPQTAYVWRKVLPLLPDDYRVVAIELPGMGNTRPLPASDTLTAAQYLKKFCDQLGILDFHLVGHDVGGWVCVTYALEFESSLRSLTIIDASIPGLITDEIFKLNNTDKIWHFYFHAVQDMPEMLIEGKEKAYLKWHLHTKSNVAGAISEEDLEVYTAAYSGKERLSNGFAYYRAYNANAEQNLSYANRLHIPLLAIGGGHSQGENIGKAMQKISNSEVRTVVIPDAGHHIAEEQPEAFVSQLMDFLSRN